MVTSSTLPNDVTSNVADVQEDTSTTAQHIGSAGATIAETAHAAVEQTADLASAAASRVQKGVSSVRSTLDIAIDEACEYGAECAHSTRQAVRAKPITALLLTLAAGMLIGRLSR